MRTPEVFGLGDLLPACGRLDDSNTVKVDFLHGIAKKSKAEFHRSRLGNPSKCSHYFRTRVLAFINEEDWIPAGDDITKQLTMLD
ncbi:hypothetical protein D3C86_1366960 [compost metagenome]